ncbi:MAG TPA: DinB family protein [Longimicrobiales bacterium]
MSAPEVWQRGPLPGVDPYLMPAVHMVMQASEDLEAAAELTAEQLRAQPGGVASVGFHLRHLAGATGRLLAYARGQALTPEQLALAAAEAQALEPSEAALLVLAAREALEAALAEMRATPRERLLEARAVGRQRLPSNVLGILTHIGEHAARHAGQILTTVRIVRSGEG